MPTILTGTVAKWINQKGIGFITPEGQESELGKDILVHFSEVKQESTFKRLQRGATVEYELKDEPSENGAKKVACNVTGPNGEDCPLPVRKARAEKPAQTEEDEEDEKKEEKPKGKGRSRRKGKGKGRKGRGKKAKAAEENGESSD